MIFRSIQPDEVDFLVSRSAEVTDSARWVRGVLERGESRLSWCRVAVDDGELVAAHALDSWSPDQPPADTPTFVSLLGHTDRQAATALLSHDLDLFRATTVQANLSCETDAPHGLRLRRQDQHHVLQAAETFAAVADASADHGMRLGRDSHGRRTEARRRLRAARRRTHEPHWFAIARDASNPPVGYVQSAMINGRAVLAEVGVAQKHRGRRFVDQLLTYCTSVLTAHGQTRVRAHTDQANSAMRRAFARAGYMEVGTRVDYRLSLDGA